MPKTTFTYGMIAAPEWFNAIQNFQFVANPDNDGEYPLITNDFLSDAPGQIKPQWTAYRDTFLVSPGTGLQVLFQGGIIVLPNGNRFSVAPGALAVPNNATTVIYLNQQGVVVAGGALPAFRVDIATVITSGGAITSIADLRPRFQILPLPNSLRVFGGLGGDGDYVLNSGSATLDREYWFRNFTLGAGATLNIDGAAIINCLGDCTINGIINVLATVSGGIQFAGSGMANSDYGGDPGRGLGGGTNRGLAASRYAYTVSPIGSGGASGDVRVLGSSANGSGSRGGNGGGAININAFGRITIAGTVNANGGAAQVGSFTNFGATTILLAGGGGGSGGLILLRSATEILLQAGSTLSARGGAGSAGVALSGVQAGGGGGGGGTVILQAPVVSTGAGTITLLGGAAGAGSGSGISAASGGGFGGNGGQGAQNPAAGAVGLLLSQTIIPS